MNIKECYTVVFIALCLSIISCNKNQERNDDGVLRTKLDSLRNEVKETQKEIIQRPQKIESDTRTNNTENLETFPIEPYEKISKIKDGMIVVQSKKSKKYGFINKSGEIQIPLIYDEVSAFSNGVSIVKKKEKYGLIDKQGKILTPIEYGYIGEFANGLALITRGDLNTGKRGYINTKGKIVIPIIYDWAGTFSEGLGLVSQNGKSGFINTKGEIVIPLIYDYAWGFSKGANTTTVEKNGRSFQIDKNGNEVSK